MERLMEDALNVHHLLPWIESVEHIINFMRKIPLDKSHLRNQLTLRYFMKQRDAYGDGFEKSIDDDAREIVIVLPGTSYKEIKDRLAILGNLANRKEVVLRQVLHKKSDLGEILKEIESLPSNKKRKSISSTELPSILNSSNNDEPNLKFKIRKKEDDSFVIVTEVKQEKTTPSKLWQLLKPIRERCDIIKKIISKKSDVSDKELE